MKSAPECVECLGKLALQIAGAASGGDPALLGEVEEVALSVVERRLAVGRSVPTRVATRLFRAVVAASGNPDPFALQKEREHARAAVASVRALGEAGEGLGALIAHSLAGNRIDFFRDIDEVEREWRSSPAPLAVDDTPALLAELAKGGPFLILADNAAEISFDLPLLRKLAELGIETAYAVKGRPSQNDLTRADLVKFGIEVENLVDTGTDWIGCDLAAVGEDFRRAWARSRVVLAKGMANLETLTEYPEELAARRVFFGLVVKCGAVARFLDLPLGLPALVDAARFA